MNNNYYIYINIFENFNYGKMHASIIGIITHYM